MSLSTYLSAFEGAMVDLGKNIRNPLRGARLGPKSLENFFAQADLG
jgi:hypothetical protein